MNSSTNSRQSGVLLLEMMIGLTILSVGLLGFLSAYGATAKVSDEIDDRDKARVAFENVAESLRASAFSTMYTTYNGASFSVPNLTTTFTYTGGGTTYTYTYPASVSASMCVNERALPAEFGPILDIDGSGSLDNIDCSTTYKILPVRLTLSYTVGMQQRTQEQFIILNDS